ncbi:POU domain, class 5, transcription factor 1.1-like [Platysternon megacephalum]|uniref:POU domain, class 5, transcription factor 1.1-like n=1 Tax=Platysternon megacephalum TaxID=55544 RepID=A0A4D9DWC0_9SAUR|nr:POU domain, class 5, transcription factor 1.1-like [Platysternon megacephalum]
MAALSICDPTPAGLTQLPTAHGHTPTSTHPLLWEVPVRGAPWRCPCCSLETRLPATAPRGGGGAGGTWLLPGERTQVGHAPSRGGASLRMCSWQRNRPQQARATIPRAGFRAHVGLAPAGGFAPKQMNGCASGQSACSGGMRCSREKQALSPRSLGPNSRPLAIPTPAHPAGSVPKELLSLTLPWHPGNPSPSCSYYIKELDCAFPEPAGRG